jgi:hypothetical protein
VSLFPVRKYGSRVPVSRDTLLDHGLVEPTAAEQAKLDAWRVEYAQRKQAATEAWPVFVAALDAVTDLVARAVLDLHKADQQWCAGCEGWDNAGESPAWPCDTVETVAKALGIPIPPDLDMAYQARL